MRTKKKLKIYWNEPKIHYVGKDSKGIWHFTTQQAVAKFVELSPIMEE